MNNIREITGIDTLRLIVSDLDGTLLNEQKEISPRALRAIAALQQAGFLFTVCTGREYAILEEFARVIRPNAPIVCNNGGEVICYPSGEVIRRVLLPHGETLALLHFCMARSIDFCVTTPDSCYFPLHSRMPVFYEQHRERAQAQGFSSPHLRCITSPEELRGLPLNKLILRTDLSATEEALTFIRQDVPVFDSTMSSDTILELMPRGMCKAAGLSALCSHLGLSLSQCCAVGDYDNDIEMLSQVGLSVAMGNALPAVMACAGYVTGTNEEDGVAQLLEQLLRCHAAQKERKLYP